MLGIFVNLIGWTGVLFLLVAYALVSTKRCTGDSKIYQSLNIAGALLLIINSFYFGAYPSVGINIAWVGIGLFTLINTSKKGKGVTAG
jgi:uncharacterized membrane protein YphA (DoxX/SURF4 family)